VAAVEIASGEGAHGSAGLETLLLRKGRGLLLLFIFSQELFKLAYDDEGDLFNFGR